LFLFFLPKEKKGGFFFLPFLSRKKRKPKESWEKACGPEDGSRLSFVYFSF